MSNFKFAPDLFLEVVELERFKDFLDKDGFRKTLLDNTVRFGLVKNNKAISFMNGKVERDLDTVTGQKTIKIRPLEAVNKRGLFIKSDIVNTIPVAADGKWYWVKTMHAYSNIEEGIVSLSIDGTLVGVGTKFTETLRGAPNFPARITFANSQFNTLEYDVLEVIDDEHAIVMHPAVNGTGIATFEVEDFLRYKVVGTFTQGIAVDPQSKYPFQYDSMQYTLVEETIENIRPDYIKDEEFYLARIKVQSGDVVVQDKRIEYWETKGSQAVLDIDNEANPLIGVEFIKWQNLLAPANENEVHIAWGMRSQNWAVDSSKNIVTFFGSAMGGKYKDLTHFNNGDFDGWRLYSSEGVYSTIISSIKQGQAINFTLDCLDVDNFSDDGGLTFRNIKGEADWLLAVPNAESIEIICTPGEDSSSKNADKSFIFPIDNLYGRCDLEVYAQECFYNIKYRYITHKTYGKQYVLPQDEVGYYTEISYTTDGEIKEIVDRVRFPYVGVDKNGYIKLVLSPNAYSTMISMIYKGDKIGVETVTSFNTIQVYELKVKRDKRYQYITGDISLEDDVYISLSNSGAVEGNEFRIQIDCDSLLLNGKKIYIIRDYGGGTPVIIKEIGDGDVYQMMNQDNGIVFDCIFSDTGKWNVAYQNYDLGQPFEVKMFEGDIDQFFNISTRQGKVKGYFGWAIHDDLSGRVPMGIGSGNDGGSTKTISPKEKGGKYKLALTKAQLPNERLYLFADDNNDNEMSVGYDKRVSRNSNQGGNGSYFFSGSGREANVGTSAPLGSGELIDTATPYYGIYFVKKLF